MVLFKPIRTVKNVYSILVRVNGTSLVQSDTLKFLWLELDTLLTWKKFFVPRNISMYILPAHPKIRRPKMQIITEH